MDFKQIFAAYYPLYLSQSDVPNSSDEEYKIALALANEAIDRWSTYDGTYWKELFETNLTSDNSSDVAVVADQTDYDAPTDMMEAGGYVQIKDNGTTVKRYQILEPQEAQFMSDLATYCWFSGDPNGGFTLHLNPAPDTSVDGFDLDFVYYKKPTLMTGDNDTPEMTRPYFMVHRMLANRFRGSRNPYYNSAKIDAEDVLKTMQTMNNSGNWANPWKLTDHSGTVIGG